MSPEPIFIRPTALDDLIARQTLELVIENLRRDIDHLILSRETSATCGVT